MALLADWLLHDFPNTYGFVLRRGFLGDVPFEDASAASFVVPAVMPTALLASGMRWAGGRVTPSIATVHKPPSCNSIRYHQVL